MSQADARTGMLGEWTGAAVEPGDGKPTPDVWTPVDVPGRPAAFAATDCVAYRTAFDDPRSGDDDRAVLELRGLYAHARVWLNDEMVGSHDEYVRPFRVSFEPEETNEVVVECRDPQDRFGGIHDTDLVPEEDSVPGIWWGADVETHPGTFIYDLEAHPRIREGEAEIEVRAVIETDEPLDDRLTLSLRPEGEFQARGMMDRASVEAGAGERVTVDHTIDVHDPSLWWPRELGPQHRYTVRAKLDDVSRSVTTGLCSIARGENGLLVNGERLPARGFNLLSATAEDVERAREANANIVRVHAHVAPTEVYEACNEAGLLLWQDLPLTGPGGFGVGRGQDVATAIARTYDCHPCLAAFTVHDDPVAGFDEPVGSGFLDRLRLRWRLWQTSYDRGPAENVAAELPDDLPVFPVAGPLGTAPDAATLYPGWDYGEPEDIDWVLDTYPVGDVVAEFGAGALGRDEPAELAGFDRAKHDAHVEGDHEDSQAYQARVLKRVTETLRRQDATMLAAYALRDTGDAGTGVLERDGTEKTGYRAALTSFEPVQAMLADPLAGVTTDVIVVNDTPEDVSGTVEWDDGESDDEIDAEVAAHTTETVGSAAISADSDSVSLALDLDDRVVENMYRL